MVSAKGSFPEMATAYLLYVYPCAASFGLPFIYAKILIEVLPGIRSRARCWAYSEQKKDTLIPDLAGLMSGFEGSHKIRNYNKLL